MKIGVLSVQGAVIEHINLFKSIGVEAIPVKNKEQIDEVDALVIPGGESTTIGKLISKYGLREHILNYKDMGKPILGTCAGLIMLSKNNMDDNSLGLVDVEVERNGFGRQRDSFEANINIEGFDSEYPAVFIRAPYVKKWAPTVRVMSSIDDKVVFVEQDNYVGIAFHPELTGDKRVHEYFVKKVKRSMENRVR